MKNRIGEQLVTLGILNAGEVSAVLEHSRSTGLRFAEAAINLGFFRDPSRLHNTVATSRINVFHLNPSFFPEATKNLLSLDDIIKYGALPLGFKKQTRLFRRQVVLNLGLLNPSRKDVLDWVEKKTREHDAALSGVRPYLIFVDEYLAVLRKTYGILEDQVKARGTTLDDTLKTFLQNIEIPRQPLPPELF